MSLRTRSTQGLIVCVPSLVLCLQAEEHFCVSFLSDRKHLRIGELKVCSFVCLVPSRTGNTQELRNWMCVPLVSDSFKDREHSGTEELNVCPFVCLVPSRTGNTPGKSVCYLSCLVTWRTGNVPPRTGNTQGKSVCSLSCFVNWRTGNTQELRNWMCVPSVSGSCRTEHTQELNGCSFDVWFLLVSCVPRLRNNQ